jgi:drug/metabolite transporter (DMT)-like permease
VISFSALAFFVKVGSQKKCGATALIFGAFATASVFGLILLLFNLSNLPPVSIVYGAIGGAGAAVSFVFFTRALAIGNYGFSSAILSASFVIQTVFSAVFLHKPANYFGVAVIVAALFLMSYASGSDKAVYKKDWWKWLVLVFIAFFLNGFPIIFQLLSSRVKDNNYFLYLFFNYLSGAVVLLPLVLKNRDLNRNVLLYGGLAGLGSFFGVFFLLKTLELMDPNITFPVYFTLYNILSAALSVFFFKDRISRLGFLGIMAGIAGIVILCV